MRKFFGSLVVSMVLASMAGAEPDLRRDATVEAVHRVMPAVVNISTKTVIKKSGYLYDWWRHNWAPYTQELPPEYSAGSGVIIDEEGYVLTNVHVVEQATEISVKLSDGRVLPAQAIAGTTKSDVALLKLVGKPGERFKAVKFAADGDLLLGETVLALGNPFGLGGSVSKGILSALPRRAQNDQGKLDVEDWLQTDAAINPGNSGGPLIDLRGELIGLNVAIYREGQGIGFAIPVQRLSEALSDLFTPEMIRGLWFGGRVQSRAGKLTVASLQIGSPADKGGVRTGDQILSVNNKISRSLFEFNRELINAGEDREISLQVQRGSEKKGLVVRLVPEKRVFNASVLKERLGLTVQELNAAVAARYGLPISEGLLVLAVERGSPADAAGFERGIVILAIDDIPTLEVSTAAKALHDLRKGQGTTATVYLPGRNRQLKVELKTR
jgi:serine protease Do